VSPRPAQILADAERIRAYVHPVRMSILDMLGAERLTVTAVARRLGVHPANLTHHFKRLERLGLIRLVEKRDTGRNLEKLYRAAARSFVVRPRARGRGARGALVLSILRDGLQGAIDSPDLDRAKVLGLLVNVRVRDGDVERFRRRLETLAAEFDGAGHEDGSPFQMSLALYPGESGGDASARTRVRIR